MIDSIRRFIDKVVVCLFYAAVAAFVIAVMGILFWLDKLRFIY